MNTPIRYLEIIYFLSKVQLYSYFCNVYETSCVKKIFKHLGDKWRDMRATLSPAFTSSKMKTMFILIDNIGTQMTKFYLEKMNEPEWKGLIRKLIFFFFCSYKRQNYIIDSFLI